MQDTPLFYYSFGYSFVALMLAFLFTQAAGVLVIAVYMAQHDEMMYNKYHIRSLFKVTLLYCLLFLSLILPQRLASS